MNPMPSLPPDPADAPGLLRRIVAFFPAIAVALLALAPWHPGFAFALLPAFALYLMAAATGSRPEPVLAGWLRPLHGGAWLALALILALAAWLYWPAQRLLEGGGLGAVLMGSAGIGIGLVLVFRFAALPALLAEADEQTGLARLRPLAPLLLTGAHGWLCAIWIMALALATLALLWPALWPQTGMRSVALLAYALLLAPVLAWLALAASRRHLAQARAKVEQDLALQVAAQTPLTSYAPGPSVDAALYTAARAGRVDEALALLDMGADPWALPAADARDQRSLPMLAAVLSDLRLLRALIAAGVDLNLVQGGLTPLLAAVRDSYHGRPDAVLMLLANGADPRPADAEGQTALHAAARAADPAIAALLLDAGAPLDALDAQGVSPLGIAVGHGNVEVARYLLERRAGTEPRGGEPALLLAAAREDDEPAMLHLLLRHKARLDARGRLGRTALHAACLNSNLRIVEALLDAGANPDLADEQGVTPLLEAVRAGASACVERLAAAGVAPDTRDAHGRNALAIACQAASCDTATVKALLALGVDPQQPAADGRRAIDHAVSAGRWAHVALLDPGYVLPACLAENDEELQDAPPLMRLRLALDRESYATARELLPYALGTVAERVAFYLDQAPGLERGAAQVLADALDPHACDEDGQALVWQVLALGPGAGPALVALLEKGAAPVGHGSLARYLNAALLDAELRPDAETLALELLARGADPFGAGADGAAPLLQALRLDWRRLLDALLACGVDPETRDAHGVTALLLACQLDNEHAVRRLVVHGAQPSARTPDGQTAHGLALALGRPHLARWMDWSHWRLPRRALRDTDLVAAAQRGDADAVERLLDLGLSLNATDPQGCTALLRACGGGHVELVRRLLARGADAGVAANSGATCLSVALTARQREVVWALLENRVQVDQRLPGDITPLMIAAALGQHEAIGALLTHGADARASDSHGGTVLHALAQFGFGTRDAESVVAAWESLLAAYADINAINAVHETPLLLLLGASFEPGTACREDVILAQLDVLLSHGVDLRARERRGFGALHLAALHGLGRVVRRLLAAGADPDQRDVLNRRPAEIALMRGYIDIAGEFAPSAPAPSIARFLREPRDGDDPRY